MDPFRARWRIGRWLAYPIVVFFGSAIVVGLISFIVPVPSFRLGQVVGVVSVAAFLVGLQQDSVHRN